MKTIVTTIFLFLAWIANGQTKINISGIVSDQEDLSALAGVEIKSNGSSAVMTDGKGEFIVHALSGSAITFSYVGYETFSFVANKDTLINVFLKPLANQIEEVVVQSYASIPKKTVVGSASLLRGSVSGVSVMSSGQKSNVSNSVVIRGVSIQKDNTESYKAEKENSFLSPLKDPLSTFAADVDVASYNNMKRFIKLGQRPPEESIRVEEMINYFQYDLPSPKANEPVAILTEYTDSPWSPEHKLLRISLKGRDIPKENLAASNFVFLVDVSGSMDADNKLPLVKSSLKMLVNQLRTTDKVAIVAYAGQAKVLLESTSGDKKMKINEVIDGMEAGGSTAGGDGLKLAYRIAKQNFIKKGNNRIVMTTDGDFNVGSSSDEDMETLIAKEVNSLVNISVLGYGMGNYKDAKLEIIADKGRGNYAYINSISEARKAVVSEFGSTLFTIAKDVKIQVEFNPKFVQYYRLVGYENRLLAAEDFNNDKVLGGDMGVGHVVTAIYDIVPVGISSDVVSSIDPLKYQKNKEKDLSNNSSDLATVKFRYKDVDSDKSKLQEHVVVGQSSKFNQASSDFKFITAVAELGMLMRGSKFKQNASFDALLDRARANKGKDDEGYRSEFIQIAGDAKALTESQELVSKK